MAQLTMLENLRSMKRQRGKFQDLKFCSRTDASGL